jgi:outer membrane protein with beta-barrel domain
LSSVALPPSRRDKRSEKRPSTVHVSFQALRILGIVWVFVCLSATEARAEWWVNPWIGLKFGGSSTFVVLEQSDDETKLALGGSGGVLGPGILGIEADFAYIPRFFERNNELIRQSSVTTLMGNVIIAVPLRITRDSLRPYVVGGVGLIRARLEDSGGIFDLDSKLFGLNVGGGAIGPVTNRVSIRFDLRHFSNLTGPRAPGLTIDNEPANLNFWRATVGVVFRY